MSDQHILADPAAYSKAARSRRPRPSSRALFDARSRTIPRVKLGDCNDATDGVATADEA